MSAMPTPASDDTRSLFKLLADRDWHSYAEVRDAIALTVPPGRALRKYQETVEFQRKYRNDPSYDTPHDETKRIVLGQRKCAQVAISNWRRADAIESRGENESKEIRVIPGYTNPLLAGFEPGAETQDPPSAAPGPPEVPPEDSDPSEGEQQVVEADSGQQPEPEPEPEQHALMSGDSAVPVAVLPQPDPHAASSYAWPLTVLPTAPVCEECGLTVGDAAKHDSWHLRQEQQEQDPKKFLLTGSQGGDVLVDVMRLELDRFQRGMQSWLMVQFAQVEAAIHAPGSSWHSWTPADARASENRAGIEDHEQ